MPRVLLKQLKIKNLGPIVEDVVAIEPFTFFVGRNNAGKSHYLRAVELLLAQRAPTKEEIALLQRDPAQKIVIEGEFSGVLAFTHLVSASNHKRAIEDAIRGDTLTVIRELDSTVEDSSAFGIRAEDGTIHNPSGFSGNLLKILPEPISIIATADTADELKDKGNTALAKLKKEVMAAFFTALRSRTQAAFVDIDTFLHGESDGTRSPELQEFETRLQAEFVGEFANVVPTVRFDLPNEDVIAKEMKIILNDGHPTEVEQKGHGLQRATLLALLRLLARHGARYQDRPSPMFLIGELESFLHPYAQKALGEVLVQLVNQYQIVTTTHSPFIVTPGNILGYRRVRKDSSAGTKNIGPATPSLDVNLIQRLLERRGNLEGLFADRVVLVEGRHDEGAYQRLRQVLDVTVPADCFTLLIQVGGCNELRQAWKFYKQLGFDVAAICDLDYLFSPDMRHWLADLSIDDGYPARLRTHIGWKGSGAPSLEDVLKGLQKQGDSLEIEKVSTALNPHRIFTLRRGAPEMYFKKDTGRKEAWVDVTTVEDIESPEELRAVLQGVFS